MDGVMNDRTVGVTGERWTMSNITAMTPTVNKVTVGVPSLPTSN
jgi:hypothetical protein